MKIGTLFWAKPTKTDENMFHVQKKHNLSNFWYLIFFYFRYAFWVDRTDTSHKNRQMHSAKTWQNLPIHAYLCTLTFLVKFLGFLCRKNVRYKAKFVQNYQIIWFDKQLVVN